MSRVVHDGCDVVIVGAGAAGAAATWRLALDGVNVVCLEQGDWVDQRQSPSLTLDWERALQTRFHPNPNVRRNASDYPVVDDDTPIKPALYNAVGGSTIRWGAHFPRMHPSDFRVRSQDGVADDWPLAYDDLVPYYDRNDRMMGVAGLAGDPANPTRAKRPMPPLPLGRGPERLAQAFDQLGWHWWPADAAIASVDDGMQRGDRRQACNHCGPCGLGCPRNARASTDITYWPAAIAAGATLRTDAWVTRVRAASDCVEGVEYVDAQGHERFQPARIVALAASGLGTPRLLLASSSRDHPDGLANRSGQVGRNLMHHPTAIVTGVFDEPLEGHRGAFACALVSQEFYETDRARGFVRGYQLQALRGQGPLATALGGYMRRLPWGRDHHATFERRFGHEVSLTVTTEDLPNADNRVTLDPNLRDRAGVPAPRLSYRVSDHSRRMLDHGIEKATEVLRVAGARTTAMNPLVQAGGFHFLGTARMGIDPSRSVTDAFGRCHDVPNLFVLDGSLFVTAGAVNPTATIQALALRCAERIAVDLGAA